MKARGVVAAGHEATVGAATTVLEEGGNAFDAALAAMCAACVAEPALASLGGGGFLMARVATGAMAGKTLVYDFFPQSPKQRPPAEDLDFFPVMADFGTAQQEFHIGMGSIATPGVVRGLFEAHADLGAIPIRQVVEPAVSLAREGLQVNAVQGYIVSVIAGILMSSPASRALFANPERPDEIVGAGQWLRLPAFADALEILAIEGTDLFHRGEMGRAVITDCAARGGCLTAADLEDYRVERRRPLTVDAFGSRLSMNPPPSSGGLLIAFALEVLRDAVTDGEAPGSTAHMLRLVRTMAATNRARVDSRLHESSAETAAGTLLAPAFVAAYRDGVAGHPVSTRGTTHLSVLDAAGNAAALTITNGEGSGYVVPGTGIMLNNMLGEEDLHPHGFHRWRTDTRISSMMAPTVAVDRDGTITVLGSGGSNRIRTAILQVLSHLLAHGLAPEDAVNHPRIHLEDRRLSVEPGFSEEALAALADEFTDMVRWEHLNMFFGGVHLVRGRPDAGVLEGAGDPRRGGVARIV